MAVTAILDTALTPGEAGTAREIALHLPGTVLVVAMGHDDATLRVSLQSDVPALDPITFDLPRRYLRDMEPQATARLIARKTATLHDAADGIVDRYAAHAEAAEAAGARAADTALDGLPFPIEPPC